MRLLVFVTALSMLVGCSTVPSTIVKSDGPNRKIANLPDDEARHCYKITALRTARHANEGTMIYQQDNDPTGWVSLSAQPDSEFEKNYKELVKAAFHTGKPLCVAYKKEADGRTLLDSVSVE